MSEVAFRFAPDIFIRLGEELNPSPSNGIIELIRNSYDANSKKCEVKFFAQNHANNISVIDDGDGMSYEDISNGWFILGKSKKEKKETRLGRIPVGDKGLGRLAALRLGEKVHVCTRHIDTPDVEYFFEIDWNEYDEAETIEQIEFNIRQKKTNKPLGTEITIRDLKGDFGRREVKKLAREMVLLADPFGEDSLGFKPTLKTIEFKDLERLVSLRYFEQAEFILKLSTDENGEASATVTDYHGQELYRANHSDLRKSDKDLYRSPKFEFKLWIYILTPNKFIGRIVSMGQVKEWLGEFGGIHIYQNDIRISPYGDKGNDWLELNLLRSRSPELMPSTNTSIGRVSIFNNKALVQKTDRSGFIENDAFNEIKRACADSLRWMQNQRIQTREKKLLEEKEALEKEKKQTKGSIEDEIDKLPKKNKISLKKKFSEYEKKRDKKERDLMKELQLYRSLSTAGISAALFSHESANNPVQLIKSNIRTVKRRVEKYYSGKKYREELQNPIERILRSADALSVLASFTLSIIEADKRRNQKVFIHKTINNIVDQFSNFLIARKIEYVVELEVGNPYFNGSIASLDGIIANLIANSVQSFDRATVRNRKIIIKSVFEGQDYLAIHILDNGPGIKDISVADIWLPGETTRLKGTGLGLTIVRDSVRDIGGSVEAIAESELGGAEFVVTIPIISR